MLRNRRLTLVLAIVGAFSTGCEKPSNDAAPSRSGPSSPSAALPSPSAAASIAKPAPTGKPLAPITPKEFESLVERISEPDEYFFSDNYVSNETSYLQPAHLLVERAQRGGAYIGVGPEQNFTYIALTRPKLAFIVDIRRSNLLLHLLFKTAFDQAKSRSQFLTRLLGRPWEKASDPGPDASIEQVIAHAKRKKPNEELWKSSHAEAVERISATYGVALDAADEKKLSKAHRAFFDRQLEVRFELLEASQRKYPSLESLLTSKSPEGDALGFLATEAAFRFVQHLHAKHRIIPVSGDFAGKRAMPAIARELERRDLPVSVFYVSNVEQYLLEDGKWAAWVRNIDALPSNEKSVFLRAYLDQGKKHPQQIDGHRTASVIQLFDHFRWRQRKKGYLSFFDVATEGVLGADAGSAKN